MTRVLAWLGHLLERVRALLWRALVWAGRTARAAWRRLVLSPLASTRRAGARAWRAVVVSPFEMCREVCRAARAFSWRSLASIGRTAETAWRRLVWAPMVWIGRAVAFAWHWLVFTPLVLSVRLGAYLWRRLTKGPMARRVTSLALYQPANPKPASFVLLLTLVTVLLVIGLIMVLSASSVEALRQYGSSWAIFERQVLWVMLGVVALVLAARIDYRRWRRVATPLLVVCLLLLVAVLVPRLGVSAGGSSRWLGVGSLRMQPSELMKLGLVLFGADLLTRRADRIRSWKATIRPLLLIVGLGCLLVIKQPDLGTALILICIAMGLLFAAGTSFKAIGTLLGLSGTAAVLVALAEPYRRARLFSFFDPWAHASSSGYQVVQSLVGLGSGHMLGVGLGSSAAKWGFLPNAYTDFIFSVLGEELGLVGALLVVALFIALAVVGIRIAVRSSERFGGLVAAGVTTWIVVQAVINIGGVVGMLPVTGVPLPFISFGGSSLVIMMAGVGMLLNVASKEQPRLAPALDPSPMRAGAPRLASGGVTPLNRPAAASSRDGRARPERVAPVARRRRVVAGST
ncbi:MAG: putative lipid II flippase FtsW, partial [Acidimicrobiales bacterium]|nr:putative lipid II flippase FtsW [Acidimicrobiales bacterium]